MILYINTASADEIIVALGQESFSGAKFPFKIMAQKKIKAPRRQAETLIPTIDRLLQSQKIKLSALKKIVVANRGGSFTALRIGVISANALAYALKIPVEAESRGLKMNKKFAIYSLVEPIYDRDPNIGVGKKLVH